MTGKQKLLIALGIIFIIAIGPAIWAIGVATSGVHGRGEQIKQVNNATNRTFQYNHFFDLFNDVKTQTVQIKTSQQQADQWRTTHTTDNAIGTNATEQARLDSIVTGLKNLCIANLNQYNADAAKILTGAQFKDNNLPDTLPAEGATCA